MVKKRNLFSQITDSRFYEGEPIQTWYVTDNITMTNSSQSYTTTVNYEGEIDTSSTRFGPQGIEYYTYTTTTNGNVTATVHPYEYVSTTSQKDVEVVKNTSVSDSYSLAQENSMSYSVLDSFGMSYEGGWIDRQTVTESIEVNSEMPSVVTASWWVNITVSNTYEGLPDWSNTKSMKIDRSNLSNNTINLYRVFDSQGGNASPSPSMWGEKGDFYFAITYKSYENNTTSKLFINQGVLLSTGIYRFIHNSTMQWTSTDSVSWSSNYPYITYYSKSTSYNTLTTLTNTYEVPAQTTSSWVEPRQVSSLV